MSANRQQLHLLVDLVEETDLDTLYNVMIRFIPEDDAEPDEIEAIERAKDEIARGDYVSFASAEEMAAHFGVDLEE
jgi:hypothetical protein